MFQARYMWQMAAAQYAGYRMPANMELPVSSVSTVNASHVRSTQFAADPAAASGPSVVDAAPAAVTPSIRGGVSDTPSGIDDQLKIPPAGE